MTKAITAITAVAAAAIILSTASESAAKDRGLPTIDIQKTCRENVNALSTMLGGDIRQDLSVCLMDEQAARDQIVKDWVTYPAIAKERCVQPKEYLPGYVEWQSCLELTRDVLKLRKEDASSSKENASSSSGSRANRRRAGAGECPVVKYTGDGSIDYVINCPGLGL
ncbi:MAG TPA: hypothetical protein VF742_07285 [Terracidiphilus sp.]